jgi:hypothetical protein
MKKLKIKISGIRTKTKPQIEWGPYEYDDLIAKAIINVLNPEYLEFLHEDGRVTLINQTDDIKEYEYLYS